MNNLLALLHDTAKDNNNITALIKFLYETELSEEQKQLIGLINHCNENLKSRLDKFYIDNK